MNDTVSILVNSNFVIKLKALFPRQELLSEKIESKKKWSLELSKDCPRIINSYNCTMCYSLTENGQNQRLRTKLRVFIAVNSCTTHYIATPA